MQISGVGAAHIPPIAGRSKEVPPGLQKRDLALPPGIGTKFATDGTKPPGIENRFPALAATDIPPADSNTDSPATDSTKVDLIV
jgi:hypothetical protein